MTKFTTEIIELKNNKLVTIRQATIEDAEKLLSCIKTYVPQSDYIPKLENEIKLTIEQEKEWINSFLTNENSLLLVAEYDNEIIGNIDLTGNLDTCIAIRLAYKKHSKVYVRSGAGIVADSVAVKEHNECINKAAI